MSNRKLATADGLIEFDAKTGEILVSGNQVDLQTIQQVKISAFKLLKPDDFANINGTWEPKRDGLIKILSSLPLSYSWQIKSRDVTDNHVYIHAELIISHGDIVRSAEAMGICEYKELRGSRSLHVLNAIAETRALKRAIETLFGSIINFYVVTYLEQKSAA